MNRLNSRNDFGHDDYTINTVVVVVVVVTLYAQPVHIITFNWRFDSNETTRCELYDEEQKLMALRLLATRLL